MKTVFITTSPKKKWSNSSYLLTITRCFTRGETAWIKFQGGKDYPRIFSALKQAEALVLAVPLYVDGLPSHVLSLLREIEHFAREQKLNFKVYGVCNCGFYEGIHCELELAMLQCWCERAGLQFCGGVGIGAGEMIGVLRLSPLIGLAAMLIEFVIRLFLLGGGASLSPAAVLSCLHPVGALISTLVFVLFSLGPWIAAAKVGRSVSARRSHPIRYSSVSFCPAFLFVFFGSIYWVLRALILHLVPGWRLLRKV